MTASNAREIAATIEHTLLRPEATAHEIDAVCDEAVRFGFAGVCVNPVYARRAANRLSTLGKSSTTAGAPFVVAAVGFPLGAHRSDTKADEARRALDDGATEIDMVALMGALIGGDAKSVRADIAAVAKVVHRPGGRSLLKVILETTVLTLDQLILGCRCCAEGEADFVKTSTGFHPSGGATVEHVRLLNRYASPMQVKAAGGIRTAAQVRAMLEAGAVRIGTSSGVAILKDLPAPVP